MPTLKPNGKRLNGSGSKWITVKRRHLLYSRDGWRCGYCDKDLSDVPSHDRTLDHIIPRRFGGPHADWNLLTACKKCNDKRNVFRRERDELRRRT
jgi:5-methylcytosine-specific restriction endonuclease McrA